MVVPAYIGSQYTTFHAAVWTCWIFAFFYFELCLAWCDFAMDSTKEQHNISCKSRKKVRRRPWQCLDKRLGKKVWAVHGTSNLTEITKGETDEKQSQEHFIWHEGDSFRKNSFGQSERSVPHTNVTFYDDCGKMCEDFVPNFGGRGTGSCIQTKHSLTLPFPPGNFFT
jgi:hypothetical protein